MLRLCAQALKAAANRNHAKKLGCEFTWVTVSSHPAKVMLELIYTNGVFMTFRSSVGVKRDIYLNAVPVFAQLLPEAQANAKCTFLNIISVFPPLLPTCNTFIERGRRLVSTPGLQLVKVCPL